MTKQEPVNSTNLTEQIRLWSSEFGFQQTGIANIDLSEEEVRLNRWLDQGFHGEMDYMARHGNKRSRPAELEPDTLSVISVRMDYFPADSAGPWAVIENDQLGFVSRYALGRDYHKLMRKRLQQLAKRIEQITGPFGYRVFVDSAPVMEKPLAAKAGLGWVGKHTNLINRKGGSFFFLGEIYTDLPLPPDAEVKNHCGTCQACIDICPTKAIVAPYQVDARRCISYLTIELRGSIPIEFRTAIGNRIYGCDDCQLICPWNRFAKDTQETDFDVRNELDAPALIQLFNWSEDEFLSRLEGSPIRRIGHECWLRNIAVALGNARSSAEIIDALKNRTEHPSPLVQEHVRWALQQHQRTV